MKEQYPCCFHSSLPLHQACRKRAPLHEIMKLLEFNSESIIYTDNNGWTPLHVGCCFGLATPCIKFLINSNTSLITMKSNDQSTPLIIALRSGARGDTIRLLLEMNPIDVSSSINNQWTPLHIAVLNEASVSILEALIQIDPRTALISTLSNQQTPLGLYWNNYYPWIESSTEERRIVSILLNPYSLMSSKYGNYGMVHSVFSFTQKITGLLPFALKFFSIDARIKDIKGRLPLHVLLQRSDHLSSNNLNLLLKAFPKAAESIDNEERLPLQIAINQDQTSWEIVRNIFECFPNAIYICDKKTGLYPFMTAALNSNLNQSFELLRLAPQLIPNFFVSD